MNRTIFETRQRAEELLKEAIAIWRQGAQSDALEGLEEDPVFFLLMSALAYQANNFDSELERLKTDVLEDYLHTLRPYGLGHAIPAVAVVKAPLQANIAELNVNANNLFTLGNTGYTFMPLLATKAVNLSIQSIVRLDGRRWKVSLKSPHIISDLSYFSFAIKDSIFSTLSVSIKGKVLPLISPWQYADLPFNECFSVDNLLYNRQQVFNPTPIGLDLFAQQNIRVYHVRPCNLKRFLPTETDQLELVFEFSEITDTFVFDKSKLVLNVLFLANVKQNTVNLSAKNPVFRVDSNHFLHLLRPTEEQLFGNVQIDIRHVAADRFNLGSLLRLLQSLIDKYDTDFYAFQALEEWNGDRTMAQLRNILAKLAEKVRNNENSLQSGIYLMLHRPQISSQENMSVAVNYLTTDGARVNSFLTRESVLQAAYGFDNNQIALIAPPTPGYDEVDKEKAKDELARYYMTTQDRIVTPSDIKHFCLAELMARYGIGKELIKSISIGHRPQQVYRGCGYEIVVDILLTDNTFIKRNFEILIPQVEILLSKMLQVRSTNIYPIDVNIQIDK